MSKSKIEWTDETWNPITGCEPVSEGCENCYAQRMAKRLKAMGQEKYQNGPDGFEPTFHESELDRPLSWKKPKRVFVCSMSDIAWASHTEFARLYARMAVSPRCTFQLLTKRPKSLAAIFRHTGFREYVKGIVNRLMDHARLNSWNPSDYDWPPKNIWVGVTAETQEHADERIPKLLQIPAAVRFVSCEPLLGPVDLTNVAYQGDARYQMDVLDETYQNGTSWAHGLSSLLGHGLDWIIAGGESGPGARPTHPDWVRSLRDQCVVADVPCLFKQWGAWAPTDQVVTEGPTHAMCDKHHNFTEFTREKMVEQCHCTGWTGFNRTGKKKAGRELDGETWDQFPDAVEGGE